MKQVESIEILEELMNSIKDRGYHKTLTMLRTDKEKNLEIINPYDKYVMDIVCESFNITLDDILFGRYMRGENKYAIGFCVYYLYDNKSLGEIHRTIFKNKNKTLLSKYRQIIFDLRANNQIDKKFIAIKNELDRKIENYKKENQ